MHKFTKEEVKASIAFSKQRIVEAVIQIATIRNAGMYMEDGNQMRVGFNDRELYIKGFQVTVDTEADHIIGLQLSMIDKSYEDTEESEK